MFYNICHTTFVTGPLDRTHSKGKGKYINFQRVIFMYLSDISPSLNQKNPPNSPLIKDAQRDSATFNIDLPLTYYS